MNSCGQHMAAHIGLHGSSIRSKKLVIPAMQVVLGGGVSPTGEGLIADKVIKLPTKRIPNAIRFLLNDYEENALEEEYFNDYYRRQGNRYFYALLKPLADKENVSEEEFFDWGATEHFKPEVGVGECAGVSYDMIGAIIKDAVQKVALAEEALEENLAADSLYHSYSGFVIAAKALLLSKDDAPNTHHKLIKTFDEKFVQEGEFSLPNAESFSELVLQINKRAATPDFAQTYLLQAKAFVRQVQDIRQTQLNEEQMVVSSFYKA